MSHVQQRTMLLVRDLRMLEAEDGMEKVAVRTNNSEFLKKLFLLDLLSRVY